MSQRYADPTEIDAVRTATPAEDVRTIALNRVSWGAVFAGVVAAIVAQLLLGMLGVGIGIATLRPFTNDNLDASTFSMAAGIWYVLAGIIASFAGGLMAGRLSGKPDRSTAALHGLTSWAAATLLIVYLLTTTIGGLVGGAFSGLASAVGGLGQTASTAVAAAAPALQNADPLARIDNEIRAASGGQDPAALRDAATAAMRAVVTGDQATVEDAKNRAAQALAAAQQIPVDQARGQVDAYAKQYADAVAAAKQQALDAANIAASVAATGALFAFVALILGGIAAWFGGRIGAVPAAITTAAID